MISLFASLPVWVSPVYREKRADHFAGRTAPIHYSLTAIVAEVRNRKKAHEICMHETSPRLPRWRPDEIYRARSKLQIEFEGGREEGRKGGSSGLYGLIKTRVSGKLYAVVVVTSDEIPVA